MLGKALADGVESVESSFGEAVKPTPELSAQRFEHYELVKGENGKPVELGRGAMGVTYKVTNSGQRIALRKPAVCNSHFRSYSPSNLWHVCN
jgi:hypothetical protein